MQWARTWLIRQVGRWGFEMQHIEEVRRAVDDAALVVLRVNRGEANDVGGRWEEYEVPLDAGMVVLDAVLHVQAHFSNDLAVRWNCKAAKCGSCSAEVNGKPKLMCKTRLEEFDVSKPILVQPLQTFPRIRDLVTDLSWNYRINEKITPFKPRSDREWRFYQRDVDRSQEMRKCIECFLCQDVCHVIRYSAEQKPSYFGPRFYARALGLDAHPMDSEDRVDLLQGQGGIGLCNITKCCTEVCPEHIEITDNAIIPAKERIVDSHHDPLRRVFRKLTGMK
ncbi:MAG: succinate dehydrogenase/fumarate reductase iron-sulfur subunit [Candidatus Tyrphobacter sp.]